MFANAVLRPLSSALCVGVYSPMFINPVDPGVMDPDSVNDVTVVMIFSVFADIEVAVEETIQSILYYYDMLDSKPNE